MSAAARYCFCGNPMSPRAQRCIVCFRKERLAKRRAVRRGNVMRVLVGLMLGLVLTQANGVVRMFAHDAPVPVLTTYHAQFDDAAGMTWDTDSGIMFAIPGVVCVSVELVGAPGVYASVLGDC